MSFVEQTLSLDVNFHSFSFIQNLENSQIGWKVNARLRSWDPMSFTEKERQLGTLLSTRKQCGPPCT